MKPELQVFFDGQCHLCSREMEHYRKRDREGRVEWIDIAHPEFDATRYGLDPQRVDAVMHARVVATEEVKTAVDAFLELWRVVPGFSGLASLVKFPLLRPLVTLGYHAFARVRPLLPQRRRDYVCADGVCRPGYLKGARLG